MAVILGPTLIETAVIAATTLIARQNNNNTTTSPPSSTLPTSTVDPAPVVIPSLWIMWSIATIFLTLRLYCRAYRSSALWWDDHVLVLGYLFLTAANGLITSLQLQGFGLSLEFKPHMHTLSTTADVVNKMALVLTKTSFAITLLRLAQGWQRWLIWFLVVTMWLVISTNAVTTWLAACDRVGIDHYEAVLPGICWNTMNSVLIAMVANCYSAIVDFVLALLPWKIIMTLQMKRHEKIGVALAMSLGVLAGIVGVMKVYNITTIASSPNIPYNLSLLFIWGQAEPCATIVATSIPMLRVLFRDFQRSRYGTSNHNGTPGGGYGTHGTGKSHGGGGGGGSGGFSSQNHNHGRLRSNTAGLGEIHDAAGESQTELNGRGAGSGNVIRGGGGDSRDSDDLSLLGETTKMGVVVSSGTYPTQGAFPEESLAGVAVTTDGTTRMSRANSKIMRTREIDVQYESAPVRIGHRVGGSRDIEMFEMTEGNGSQNEERRSWGVSKSKGPFGRS